MTAYTERQAGSPVADFVAEHAQVLSIALFFVLCGLLFGTITDTFLTSGNLLNVIRPARLVTPVMVKQKAGAIVNISSLYGLIGSPDAISYHASKAAVRVMGKGAALEFAKQGIRVNTIFPGQIRTPILGAITPEQDAAIKASIPMGEVGDPMDIAHGSLFLASDEARYITGAVTDGNGGGCMAALWGGVA